MDPAPPPSTGVAEPSDPGVDADEAPGRRGWTVGRVAAVVVVLGLTLMWIYAFSGVAAKDPPDQLDDPAFAEAAEPVCAAARDELESLPAARDADSPEERAVTVRQANATLTAMVDQLEELVPGGDDRDQRITRLWLADWRTHLEDRSAYADSLASGSTDPAEFTARGGRSITATIDNFAEVNDMASCTTPLDL